MNRAKDRFVRRALFLGTAGLLLPLSIQCGGYSNPAPVGNSDAAVGSGGVTATGSGGSGTTGSGGSTGSETGGTGVEPGTGGSVGPGTGGDVGTGTGGGVGPGTGGGVGTSTGGAGGIRPGTGGTGPGTGGASVGTGGAGGVGTVKTDPAIDGPFATPYEYKVHHPFRMTLDGPMSSDTGNMPNPFLDYRLVVTFRTPSGKVYPVAGYFAGDGNFGSAGNKWRVHFNPPEVGAYTYTVEFRAGANVAITTGAGTGTAMAPDGKMGTFSLIATDKTAPDFRATGKVTYNKKHYLHTIGDGKPWIKTGSNSPENFLGYNEFSNTDDGPGGLAVNFLHSYGPHVADWKMGDPTWNNGKGRGIIGVINYYASVGVNSIGFIGQNLNGDGNDTIPWISRTDRTHFDNKKLQEWEVLFSHMETKGVAFTNFLSEQENFNLLGLTTNGRVYYHEIVARFAHHGGVMWNIGEENAYSNADRKGIAAYLMAVDAYKNATGNHSLANQSAAQFPALFGDANIVLGSMQETLARPAPYAVQFRRDSAAAGFPWVIMYDEQTPAGTGVSDCPTPGSGNCDNVRRITVWPFLMSGGGGFEWYMGYGNTCTDVNCENLRSRDQMFKFSRYAREFLQRLPLNEMQPADTLVNSSGRVLRKVGAVYAVYLPNGGNAMLNLAGETGPFQVRFFNVLTGMYGPTSTVTGGAMV
ncbi:MAG: DUF5060 domain-containing protein, partial [Deltaproteobacteria bacterium]|nr:DUF5060 domain-containing protein [Deltaproteobacteria bacterium]